MDTEEVIYYLKLFNHIGIKQSSMCSSIPLPKKTLYNWIIKDLPPNSHKNIKNAEKYIKKIIKKITVPNFGENV